MKLYPSKKIDRELIKQRECKFVWDISTRDQSLMLVKERIVDTSDKPHYRMVLVEDFTKPVYIHNPHLRHYHQPKERVKIEECQEYQVTKTEENYTIMRALGIRTNKNTNPREVIANNPYVYNYSMTHETYFKYYYSKRNGEILTPFNVAVFDIETDTLHKTEKTKIATLSYKDKAITAIVRDFLPSNLSDEEIIQSLQERRSYYLDDMKIGLPPKQGDDTRKTIKDYYPNFQWEIVITDTSAQAIQEVFKRAHLWSPDIIAVWNINFDFPRIIKDLEEEGVDLATVFSDPIVPKDMRSFRYIESPPYREKGEARKRHPLKPAERWHRVYSQSSFIALDAMCVYYMLRKHLQDLPSYKLDYVLDLEIGIRKLKFTEADHLKSSSLDWHNFLQEKYPLEYIVYNLFDCMSVEFLDLKTKDMSVTLPTFCHYTHFNNFSSSGKKIWDEISCNFLDHGYASGITFNLQLETDKMQISPDDWICNAPTYYVKLIKSAGILEETNELYVKFRTHTSDADVSSAYPTNQVVLNLSKETTSKELISIQGVHELKRRVSGLNLSGGHVNAYDISRDLFKAKSFADLDKLFQEHLQQTS